MKIKVPREVEIEIAAVKLILPVRYGEDDIPNDFPGRDGDQWEGIIDLRSDGAYLRGWPRSRSEFDFHMKVVDGGQYYLLDANGETAGKVDDDYVPHGVVPGSYGDYVELSIAPDGKIMNWPKSLDVEAFDFNV